MAGWAASGGADGRGNPGGRKVIAGAVSAESGEVRLRGRAVSFRNPHEAKAAGIATVYQEMSLVPTLSVAENVLLGVEPRNVLGFVDPGARREAVQRLVASVGALGQGLDPDAFVGDLPVDKRQIVEILKALAPDPTILLFDESTSSLDKSQVEAFFSLVRTLKARGRSIIFISHRMEEIFAIGDRVTVMRNGATVATFPLAQTSKDEVVGLMVKALDRKRSRATRGGETVPCCSKSEACLGRGFAIARSTSGPARSSVSEACTGRDSPIFS
jgi:ribose transport system ATP-binding protein